MQLFLMRHGIPIDPELWGGSDRARPLTDEGREQVREVIAALSLRLRPEIIWTSPYARTEETALISGSILESPVLLTEALASGANLLKSLPRLQGAPEAWPERLLCVGHQPDLSFLTCDLIGSLGGQLSFGRAGVAFLQGEFRPGGMKLEWLMTAEEILNCTL